jgi:hypothetical protein
MVSAVSSGSAGYGTSVSQQMRSQTADRIFKSVDTNQDSKITEDELAKAVEASGNSSSSAEELFKQLDQGGKGYITKQDLEAGLAKEEAAKTSQSQQTSKSGKGGGHAGGGGGASASTSTDPEDLNGDGVVTSMERIEYALKAYKAQQEAAAAQ